MGLNLEQKKAVVAEVSAQVASAQTIVVAEYRGINVGEMTKLRAKARASGVYFRVLRTDRLTGPLAYGISTDPVAAAKVMHEYAKANEKFVIRGGAMANLVMEPKAVAQLATMPSREELLSMLLGTMQAPIATFVRTLNEVPGRFVRTVAAVRDQKESQPA